MAAPAAGPRAAPAAFPAIVGMVLHEVVRGEGATATRMTQAAGHRGNGGVHAKTRARVAIEEGDAATRMNAPGVARVTGVLGAVLLDLKYGLHPTGVCSCVEQQATRASAKSGDSVETIFQRSGSHTA